MGLDPCIKPVLLVAMMGIRGFHSHPERYTLQHRLEACWSEYGQHDMIQPCPGLAGVLERSATSESDLCSAFLLVPTPPYRCHGRVTVPDLYLVGRSAETLRFLVTCSVKRLASFGIPSCIVGPVAPRLAADLPAFRADFWLVSPNPNIG